MLIISGHLTVGAERRDAFLDDAREAVELARAAPGCLDFALSADVLDPTRVNVYERWTDDESLHAFRGSGPSGEQMDAIQGSTVRKYRVSGEEAP